MILVEQKIAKTSFLKKSISKQKSLFLRAKHHPEPFKSFEETWILQEKSLFSSIRNRVPI